LKYFLVEKINNNFMAVNLILKNNSSESLELELIDFYGGNYRANISSGTAQNHALMENSEIKLNGNVIHLVVPEDENMEIVVAG
jgi:hypothetical protein